MKYLKRYKLFEKVINVNKDIDIFKLLLYKYKDEIISGDDKIFKKISGEFFESTEIKIKFIFAYPWGVPNIIRYKFQKHHIYAAYTPEEKLITVVFAASRTFFKRLKTDFKKNIITLIEILSHEFVHFYQDKKSAIKMTKTYSDSNKVDDEYYKDKNEIMAIANGVYQLMRQYDMSKEEMLYFLKYPHEFSKGAFNNKYFKDSVKGKPMMKKLFLLIKKLITDGLYSYEHDKLVYGLHISHFYEYLFLKDRKVKNRIKKYIYQYIDNDE